MSEDGLELICIGEAMAELRGGADGGFVVGFAGDTYNTAVYAQRARQQKGAVGFMTRVGMDPLSEAFVREAEREGIDTHALSRHPDRNIGVYSVSTDASGERSFHYWRSQSAARSLFHTPEDLTHIPEARVIYLSGITLAILSPTARENLIDRLTVVKEQNARSGSEHLRVRIAYDSNHRPKLWQDTATAREVTERMWELADLAFPSLDDEMALFDERSEVETVRRFERGSFDRCTIKRGERGPLALTLNSAPPSFPPAARVTDTTAAGDSFNGGYLAAFLAGQSERECLRAGHDLASRVVGQPGAIAPR